LLADTGIRESPIPRKEPIVATPYYTIERETPEVYHNKNNCPDGKQILEKNKRYGTDDRDLCKECPKVSD
jgi:hypothetical protein